jgi:hypothetical protein
MPAKKNTRCRYCGSDRLSMFLSLGEHPPSDSFLKPEQLPCEQRYPLEVYLCESCALVQLLDVVPAEEIFDDYVYLASSSRALKNHYAGLAALATERLGLGVGDVAVDIGCNDGVLLSGYRLPGLRLVGVEPSKVAQVAIASGFDVVRGFFGPETARAVVERAGRAKVVTATNVFPHVDDIHRFVEGLSILLAPDGAFIIEASYLVDLIDLVLFDTIYHEHLCYLALTPMIPFLDGHGLEVFNVQRVPFGASGPAIRVWVQRTGAGRPIEPTVAALLADEERWGVRRADRYLGYAAQVEAIKGALLALLGAVRSAGHRIGGYGAPAKGNTLLNYLRLTADDIECIAETNALKQGMLTPGSHIPVVSEDEFLRRMPPYALLLSWNYLDFFLENSPYIRRGGRFIVPIPEPRITP